MQELSDNYLDSIEFKQEITRRVISRVCAQIYDRLGRYLGILNSSIKIILSGTCELHPGTTQLDQEFYTNHKEKVELACQLLKNYKIFDQILPFPCGLIPSRN